MGSPKSEQNVHAVLDQVLGYLNFSAGNHDAKFLANLNFLFGHYSRQSKETSGKLSSLAASNDHLSAQQVGKSLSQRLEQLSVENTAFRDCTQSKAVLEIVFKKLLSAYRKHHRDLLFHQSDEFLFNAFFVGRAFEAVLRQTRSWDEVDEIVSTAVASLNDYLGHRPVATLESQKIEPYDHEWIRPVPIYVRDAGVAEGRYHQITERALRILRETDHHILRAAHFDPEKLDELAIDPRAFDFDHPINQRPNHHFGQWDERLIDGSGSFRRFIVHQVTLDALIERAKTVASDPTKSISLKDTMLEASAVMAGTMLMASGISGSGPATYDSNTTLSTLLPTIADYRDQFYTELMESLPVEHQTRLKKESRVKHQPFGGVRQDLNAQLAQRRASQLVNCRLASIFARMGYPDAAVEQSKVVPVAAARINCQIDCLLSAANEATLRGELDEAFEAIPRIMSRLKRGIHCGAIVDPWNILGFDANYSLFPAVENSVRDHRVFDLVDVMERIFAHCSRLWSEAAASDREDMCESIRKEFLSIVNWWRQYAAHEVIAVDAVDADDIFQAAELVAEALSLWQKGGAAAGDIEFWAQHAELFDTPNAYALVIDALMQRRDYQTSTALLVHWMSQSEYVPLQQGDSSFHNLVYRWITEQKIVLRTSDPETEHDKAEMVWNRIRKFYDFIEANADHYWTVPKFEINRKLSSPETLTEEFDEFEDSEFDSQDEHDVEREDLFRHAYDDVTYTDTTDDGFEGEVFDGSLSSDDALEAEVDRVLDRLEFLSTISEYWSVAATIPLPVIRRDQVTHAIGERLKKRREITRAWVKQATRNRENLIELLDSINQYSLPATGSDHDAMLLYDQHRLYKDSLLDQTINTCIETENAIRMLVAVVQAVDHLVDGKSLVPFEPASSVKSAESSESNQPSESATVYVNGGAPVVCVYAALLIHDPKQVVENFPALTEYLSTESLLYVPLSKGGNPAAIVRARVVQMAILDLLRKWYLHGWTSHRTDDGACQSNRSGSGHRVRRDF